MIDRYIDTYIYDGWMDRHMRNKQDGLDGWMGGWMDKYTDRQIDMMDRYISGWMDGLMDR